MSPATIWVEVFSQGTHYQLKTEIQIKGVCVSKDNIAVWNGKKVLVYDLSSDLAAVKLVGKFFQVNFLDLKVSKTSSKKILSGFVNFTKFLA